MRSPNFGVIKSEVQKLSSIYTPTPSIDVTRGEPLGINWGFSPLPLCPTQPVLSTTDSVLCGDSKTSLKNISLCQPSFIFKFAFLFLLLGINCLNLEKESYKRTEKMISYDPNKIDLIFFGRLNRTLKTLHNTHNTWKKERSFEEIACKDNRVKHDLYNNNAVVVCTRKFTKSFGNDRKKENISNGFFCGTIRLTNRQKRFTID